MKEYLTSFPKNEDWRFIKDRECLLDQYADSLKIFLDEDVEDLLMDGLYEEAYKKLCSKFPEIIVTRIQNDKATPDASNLWETSLPLLTETLQITL